MEETISSGQLQLRKCRKQLTTIARSATLESDISTSSTECSAADIIEPGISQLWKLRPKKTNLLLRTRLVSGLGTDELIMNMDKWLPSDNSLLYSETETNALEPTPEDVATHFNQVLKEKLTDIMKKDKLVGLEKEFATPPPPSKTQRQKMAREKRNKDAGKDWYNLPRQVPTKEEKQELMAIRLRSFADPGKFYKNTHKEPLPEFYEFGYVVSGNSSDVPKKQAKQSIVDELLQSSQYRKYAKRKVREIQEKHTGSRRKRQKRE